jgi:hypothetical protein
MAQRVAGIATIKVNGRQYALKGNFTVSPDSIEREEVAGQDFVHGFKETPRAPFIEGDLTLTRDLSIVELRRFTAATVQADLSNGHSYVLRDAFTTSAHDIDTAEGQVRVRFAGLSCIEMMPD